MAGFSAPGFQYPAPAPHHPNLTITHLSDKVSDMKVSSRDFQRNFARVRATAETGEPVYVSVGDSEFVFQRVQPKSWQGALKGKATITGDLHSTDLAWEANQ